MQKPLLITLNRGVKVLKGPVQNYAPGVMGFDKIGAPTGFGVTQTKRVQHYTAPYTGFMTGIYMRLAGFTNHTDFMLGRAIAYYDNAGLPGAFIGVGSEITVFGDDPPEWRFLPFPRPIPIVSGQTYWIGLWDTLATTGSVLYFDTLGFPANSRIGNTDTYSSTGNPPDPFGANTLGTTTDQMALYAATTLVNPIQDIDDQTPSPMLMKLGERVRPFRLLGDSILGELPQIPGTGIDYVDSDVISSVTSVQSSESTDFVDTSGAVNGTSSVISTETVDFVDSSTVATSSSVIAADIAAYVEADTATSITSVSSGELFVPYIDRGFVTPLLIKLGEKVRLFRLLSDSILGESPFVAPISYTDSATISSTTSVQSSESTDFVDTSGAINSTSSVISTEISQYVESATVGSSTSVSAVETTDYVESATASSVTSIASSELFVPFIEEASSQPLLIKLMRSGRMRLIVPARIPDVIVSNVNYTDSATISSTTSVQSSESTDFVDTSGAVNGTSSVTSTELSAFVDASTVVSSTSVVSVEVAAYVDADTPSSVTAVSSVDTAQYVETATVPTITSITTIEAYWLQTPLTQPLLIKLAWGRGKLRLLDQTPNEYGVSYEDVVTVASSTSVISTETANYVESGTIAGITSVSALEEHTTYDVATITSQSSVISSDIYDVIDSSTGATTTFVTSLETTDFVDSDTVSSVTALTSTDVAAYVDADAPSTVTSISASDVEILAPIPASIRVLLIRLARYHRQLKLLGSNTLASPPPIAGAYTESAVISTTSSVSSTDVAAYVESQTVTSRTTPITSEVITDVDSNTTTGHTSVISTEITAYVDSATTGSVSTPSSTDFAAFLDSALVSSTTSTQPVELFGAVDAATLVSTTTLTSADIVQYVEGGIPSVISYVSATETYAAIDSATLTTITSLTYTEELVFAATSADSATILTTTTIPHTYEYGPIVDFALIGTATSRWNKSGVYSRYIVEAQKHFDGSVQFNGLVGSMRRKWKI